MKRGLLGVVVCIGIAVLPNIPANAGAMGDELQFRGDCNGDGSINVSDPVFLSNFLYSGGQAPPCLPACDANADGSVNGSDVIFLNNALFSGGPQPYGTVVCE